METKKFKRCKNGTRRNPKTKRCRKVKPKLKKVKTPVKVKSPVPVKLSEHDLQLIAYDQGLIVNRDDTIKPEVKAWMKSIPFSKESEQFYKYNPAKSDEENLYRKVSGTIDSYRKDGMNSVDLTDVRDARKKSPLKIPTVKSVTLTDHDLQLIAYEKGLIENRTDTIKPEVKTWMKSIPFSRIADDDEQFYTYDWTRSDHANLYRRVSDRIDDYRKYGNKSVDLTDVRDFKKR